jgi:predicted small lipoprotein YifL
VKTLLRAPLALQLLVTVAACGELVGVGEVPTPAEGGVDATRTDARGSSDDAGLDSSGGRTDGATPDGPGDGPGVEAASGEGSTVPVDGSVEAAAPEAGAVDASTEAGVETAACTATWDTYRLSCNACGIAQCCTQLAACEVVDDAGLDMGMSRCAALVYCITGYSGSSPPMLGDTNCKMDDQYSPTELANESAVLSCARTSCSVECPGL